MNYIKFVCIGCLFLIFACKEDTALTHKTYYIEESTKEWYINDSISANFVMIDSKGLQSSYTMNSNYTDFSPGKTTIMGIPTKATKTEQKYQSFNSTYNLSFSISVYPHTDNFGDELQIYLGEYSFGYDLLQQRVTNVWNPYGNASLMMTSDGYKIQNHEIKSTIEFLDEYTVQGKTYESVLHFTSKDFIDKFTDFSITDIYYTKQFGLIKFVYKNGIINERIPNNTIL